MHKIMLKVTHEYCKGGEGYCSLLLVINRMLHCTMHTKQVATFAENSNNEYNLVPEAPSDAYCTKASWPDGRGSFEYDENLHYQSYDRHLHCANPNLKKYKVYNMKRNSGIHCGISPKRLSAMGTQLPLFALSSR